MSSRLPDLSYCNKNVRDGKEAHLAELDRMPSPCPVCGKKYEVRFSDGPYEQFKHLVKIGKFSGRGFAMRAEYCKRKLGEA